MDLFRFTNPRGLSRMEQGELIEGYDSLMWVERYRDAGEFEIKADLDSGVREALPVGSFISHIEADEMMIVENHEVSEDYEVDEVPSVTITGRGIESFFEQRVAGSNRTFPTTGALPDLSLGAQKTWAQARSLLRQHIDAAVLVDNNNALPYFEVVTTAAGAGDVEERPYQRGDLYSALLNILAVDDLGIKVLRPGRAGDLATRPENSVIVIHRGRDRSDRVLFSYNSGDINSADYLWSIKGLKNYAYCFGKWVDTVAYIGPAVTGFDRRWVALDMSDLDQQFNEAPEDAVRTVIRTAMEIRAKQYLASQISVALSKAELSKDRQTYKYRRDYEVGDYVSVTGNYNEGTIQRVVEHVEIEDATGSHSYPTLAALDGEVT